MIDTYGLCSFQNPQQVVREMSRVCAEDGTLVFLEHGKSVNWQFLTNYLNKHAQDHYDKV